MSKFNLSDGEKDILKVAYMDKQKSESLKSEMTSLSHSVDGINSKHEQFLSEVEHRLGVTNTASSKGSYEFQREGEQVPPVAFDDLVKEANAEIKGDVDFEDLLTQKEIAEAYARLKEIDEEFSKKTGLQKKDYAFLAVAVALQCLRQYFLDPWLKKNRPAAGSADEAGLKDNKEPGWYYVATDKILTNRVPFDVHRYSSFFSVDHWLKGGDHRLMTLGHDPVFGWIFGTANIMTGTVTRRDRVSAHVKCINNENIIYALADTRTIFSKVFERVAAPGMDGKIALGCALVREFNHLNSDFWTKRGLPLPGIGIVSLELGKTLARYGIDTAGVATELFGAVLINMIIAMIHRLWFDEAADDPKFYEVRTRKIILYSDLIASTSNLIAVYVKTKLTKQLDLNMLDVGGLLVTLYRLVTDVRFICKVRDEFVQRKLDENFQGISEEIDRLNKKRFSDSYSIA